MSTLTAFSTSFTSTPLRHRHHPHRVQKCSHANISPIYMSSTISSPPCKPTRYTRRVFVSLFGATFGLSAVAHAERAMAAMGDEKVSTSLQSLQQIRSRVDDIDALITNAKWDSVRTVLATRPVLGAKDACNQLLGASSQDLTGAIVGLREDLVSAIRLLDTSVYSNVFVGEDRQILGTKVDYDVPRTYLADVKEALDSLIDIASS